MFNSFVAFVCLVMAQNGMAWHFQGVVWNDANKDGIRQSGETGVSNVTVKVLNCTNGAVAFSTVTASDGSFTVTDSQVPLNGDYQVLFTNLPSGYVFTQQIYPPPTNGTIVSTANPITGFAPCFVFNQLTNDTLNNAGILKATSTTATALTPLVECPGNSATFSTVASGTGPFSYVWRLNGSVLSGKTTNSLVISPVSSANAGTYSVVVAGKANNVTNSATLTVSTNTTATSLTSLTLCPGSPATFTTTASGTGPFSYVWRLNGTQLNGQTTHTLNIPSVSSTNAGTYGVEVYGSCNSVTNTATLTVSTKIMATPLTSLVLCPGGTAGFTTLVSGSGPFSYVWRFNGAQLSGQTTNTLNLPSVSSANAGNYSVEVYGSCNSVTNSATLTVSTNITATALTSQMLCPGSTATFSTTASGTGPFSYVWRLNGAQLSGQTSHSITIPSVSSTNAGTYCVEVYGSCNSVTNTATLTVNTNTTATPLTSQILCPGSPATFATTASGTGPFTYVWRLNGAQLSGQTTGTLNIPSVASTNAGLYSVEVYGSCNSVTNNSTLTVSTNVTATPLTSQVLCPGSPATFSTIASGTGPFSFVWRLNGTQLSGQSASSFNIPSVSSTNAGTYCVEVYGSCNSVTNTATLTVSTNTTATALTSLVLCPGSPATFSTTASGTGPFSYIWRLNGTQLNGQTSHSITIPSVSSTNAGTYCVEVYGSCSSVTNNATLMVSTNITATSLTSLTLCPGSPAAFSTTASGTGPFSYVWRLSGAQLSGQTSHSITIPSVSSTNAGTYCVEVYGSCNSVTNTATLTISTNVTATPFTSLTLCPGSPATFSTTASGTGPFSYVWRLNGAQLSGQSASVLNIPSVSSTNAGTYCVEVYGSCSSVTNTATLTVSTNVTVTPLTSQVLCPGSPATFTTTASGTGPFSYVWRLNGAQLSGQSASSLNIPSVSSTNAGTYSVEVYGSCNSATNTATLTVNTNTTATPLTSLVLCPGSPATFSTTASGTGPFSYVWRLNGAQLSSQTSHSITIPSVSSTNAGTYCVEVYGSCSSVTNNATLTVSTNITATPLTSLTQCPGSPATFSTIASGTGPFSYVWRLNGTLLNGQTTNALSIPSAASTNAGTYSVEVYGSCNSVTNSATLTISTNISATPLTSQVLCPGSPATFSTIASGTGPFTYVWRLNGTQLSGQSTSSLNIPSVSSTNAGTYCVEVYGSCNSATNSATLTVNTSTTATPLTSLLKSAGSSAMFSTVASGTGPFTYVWRRNGSLLAGQFTNSLSISSVSSTNVGTYTVEVYGSCDSVTNTASLTLAAPPTVTILSPTNGSTFIALADITILAQVQDFDSTVTNVEFFAVTNAPGVTNIPGTTTLFAATNKLGQTTSGPPYFILWTNVTPGIYYLGARGKDALGAVGLSQIVTVNVLDQPPVIQTGPMQFNPQTDVFEQPVRVTNPTYYTYDGVRLLIGNLAPGVQVYNATGITNGLPFVQSILPIPPGGTVDFTIEYYVLSRIAPNPVFTVQLVEPLNAVNQVGPTQHINRGHLLPDKNFLVEFNTISNRVYYLQYSSDLKNWNTTVPAIAGSGNIIDWIDGGPPQTDTPPSAQAKRFYRLILLP